MNSIRVRLLASLLVVLAAGAALLGLVAYRNILHETESLFDYQLRQMALSLRDQGAIAPEQANALKEEDFDFVVQIWTADGRTVYASRQHSELPSRAVLGFADVPAASGPWRTFSVAAGGRVIQVAQPLRIRSQLAAQAALRSVAPLLWVAPLLGLAMWGLVARALKPLRRVAQQVGHRDAAALAPLPLGGLPDEVAPLVSALNELLGRLDASFGAQRAFVADAAHELRSPLTALRLQISRLRRSPDDAAMRESALAALSAGVDRATRLVEQLLTLARSEPSALPPPERLDLAELVRQAVAETVPYALSRGSELALEADAPVWMQGERAALTALARNLADNALRYAPPGARVELHVAEAQGVPTLVVDDSGPGIPEAERGRVFDRFYRRDADGEQGSGLGLAIVRSVAERHAATVELGDSPLGGLRVAVRFGGGVGQNAEGLPPRE